MRFLVVDDELAGRRNIETALRKIAPDSVIDTAQNAAEAMELCRRGSFDVAFLDIKLRGKDGLTLAQEIQELKPRTNIIMVTAYDRYALEAHKLFVSGYIMKPPMEEDVRRALNNLRYSVEEEKPEKLQVRCFGDFEVFYGGVPVRFRRSKAKELLAFLIDRRGAAVNTGRICSAIWETDHADKTKNHFRQILSDLRKTLREVNAESLMVCQRNSFAIDPEKIDCDYFRYLEGDPDAIRSYHGEYMVQYSWAEATVGALERSKEK